MLFLQPEPCLTQREQLISINDNAGHKVSSCWLSLCQLSRRYLTLNLINSTFTIQFWTILWSDDNKIITTKNTTHTQLFHLTLSVIFSLHSLHPFIFMSHSQTIFSFCLLDTFPTSLSLFNFSSPPLSLFTFYEESVVVRFKSNLLLMSFCLHIINYNS
jgi:hypothetical protein